ncbi:MULTISPECIES: hypothetical protein [unclassified Hydrogenobaculum]|uniref:hypothetical protein n=1 Tax=unclassified Hydrogenobaculum TaxID=2622382 RepID=UPI0001C51C2D|nr:MULTISPECIES: hypothetical protein [unclassified Hydrogenobaculum]AEF19823.1 protein of unknown function DUF214 [Hydrogenobaculum sp. 3684]AEG47109.1 hypothetical protein HydSHO_1446 [Hydrogenobaculum sp. SHO]AGG15757.1 protein of unknown function DUF214 [Hydrogenobaculum sp. HO]AGH94057.1 hypothetical protein HydSN_1490 [Hydrogenobaculum sp. SN]
MKGVALIWLTTLVLVVAEVAGAILWHGQEYSTVTFGFLMVVAAVLNGIWVGLVVPLAAKD